MQKFTGKIQGDRVEDAMSEAGLNQHSLAAAIGMTQVSVHNVIHGIKQLSIPKFVDLCRALHRSSDYLLGLSDNPTPATGAPNVVIRVFKSEQEAGIANEILDCLGSFPVGDQLFTLALIKKINQGPHTARTSEAVEAGAVIDTLPAPARTAVLAEVYSASNELTHKYRQKEEQLLYLVEVARSEGIDVDRLIADKFGVIICK